MSLDGYRTLGTTGEAVIRERASKFHAYAFPCATTEAFKERLGQLVTAHRTARHVAYAYRIDGEERISDGGEPNGTAGRPILIQLCANDLENVAIVVVRYFGGTKLGKGGLARAFSGSAAQALAKCEVREERWMTELRITCPIATLGRINELLHARDGTILHSAFDAEAHLHIRLPRALSGEFLHQASLAGCKLRDP
ncbi:MAG: YigZ family protein [Flavobacteriales bacterium]|nr:YigZ family protein [Flavobacteriales bacterium]